MFGLIDLVLGAIAELRGCQYLTPEDVRGAYNYAYTDGHIAGYQAAFGVAEGARMLAELRRAAEIEDAADRGWTEGFDLAVAIASVQREEVRAEAEAVGYATGYLRGAIDAAVDEAFFRGTVGGRF